MNKKSVILIISLMFSTSVFANNKKAAGAFLANAIAVEAAGSSVLMASSPATAVAGLLIYLLPESKRLTQKKESELGETFYYKMKQVKHIARYSRSSYESGKGLYKNTWQDVQTFQKNILSQYDVNSQMNDYPEFGPIIKLLSYSSKVSKEIAFSDINLSDFDNMTVGDFFGRNAEEINGRKTAQFIMASFQYIGDNEYFDRKIVKFEKKQAKK